jgi:peptidoglycan/xylan/chitin deacetylase (PgdA/CDA1 family)
MLAAYRKARGDEVLNLCFHGIGTPGRPLEPDEELYWVPESRFTDLLEVIAQFPQVRISFDDGNKSDAAIALPELKSRDLTATFFVIADRLDQPGSLSSEDVRSLVDGGMTVGSHGMRHRPWRSVNDHELNEELVGAAEAIAQVSGRPVREVACPFGSYDRRVLAAIRRSGFHHVYTVDGGPARSNAWLQSRYTVHVGDTPADIERRMTAPRGAAVTAAVRKGKALVKQWR